MWICLLKRLKKKCEQRQSFPLTFLPPCPAPSFTQTSGKSLDCPSLHNHTCPQLLLLLPHPIPSVSLSGLSFFLQFPVSLSSPTYDGSKADDFLSVARNHALGLQSPEGSG